jgi:hypothetical protein
MELIKDKNILQKIKAPLLVIGLIILLASVGSAVFFYRQYKAISKAQQSYTEIEQIVKKVSVLMELPQGETPTLATVSDKAQLQNQNFFQNAENGDRILLYSQAQRAILYRPSTNKIVDVAPVMPLNKAEVAGESTSLIKVAIINGSGLPGLTPKAEEKLQADKEISSKVQIAVKENAQNDYQETLVVDLGGKQLTMCQKIAQALNGKVTVLPVGEVEPEAEILIILGNVFEQSGTTGMPSVTSALLRLAVFNGTKITGLTKTAEANLQGKIVGFEVTARGNAKADYDNTLVVDLSGKQNELTAQIANEVKGEVAGLPEGEIKPDAEIMIILGTNYLR